MFADQSPIRRHLPTRSSPRRTSSKVARPSGLANDHVISHIPRVPFIGATRRADGQRYPGVRANSSHADENTLTAIRNAFWCSGFSRLKSASNDRVVSNLTA